MEQFNVGEKLLARYRRFKNKLLPPGTTRRRMYRWLLNQLKLIFFIPPNMALIETLVMRYRRLESKLFPEGTMPGEIYRWITEFFKVVSGLGLLALSKLLFPRKTGAGQSEVIENYANYDIICFSIIDWHFRYQRPQQILNQFGLRGHRVFYINASFVHSKLTTHHYDLEEIENNIYSCSLNSRSDLNIYHDLINEPDLELMKQSLNSLIETQDIRSAICLVDLPFWSPLAYHLRSAYGFNIVYDCMDEHSGFSSNTAEMVAQEKELLKESGLIVVSAQRLYDKCIEYKDKLVMVRNAADINHFMAAERKPGNPLSAYPKPIIGYYGAIADWFDVELLKNVARRFTNYSFVLIGHTANADLTDLKKLFNVYLIEEVPYEILPGYLAWFDVCMIPFKITPLTLATNPVKFYEFLGAGKPVVSVKLPELEAYKDFCYLAETPEEFATAISLALSEDSAKMAAERVNFARDNTWEARVNTIRQAVVAAHKKVSVVIVTYNNLHLTKQCIESIKKLTAYPNYEIIVVDNNSKDETPGYLRELADKGEIIFIGNKDNKGFSAANNQGIKAGSGEYIILLNNDTIVTKGWMSRLVYHLNNPAVGLVGPVSNWVGNEAKIDTYYDSYEEMHKFAGEFTKENWAKTFDIHMLAMFCLGMRRQIVDEMGYLDENFGIGSFEDDDFSHRVRLKKYRIVCARDVFVHHEGMASFKKLEDQRYKELFERNKHYFEGKWDIKWQPHYFQDE